MSSVDLHALADQIGQREGLPPGLLPALVHQESGFNPSIRSPVGAMGLTQLMPATARGLGVTNPNDPVQNLTAGARYLKEQLNKFGSVPLALAAYNAGPGAVSKYGGVPPYHETQNYVKNIMAMWGQGGGAPQGPALPPTSGMGPAQDQGGAPPLSPMAAIGGGDPLQMLKQSAPTNADVSIMQRLGGEAADAQQGLQSIAQGLPDVGGAAPSSDSQGASPTQQPQQEPLQLPVTGLTGEVPMTFSHGQSPYSNLHFSDHVDWQHINPRLLSTLNKVAAKKGVVAEVISGYRSNDYSSRVGGFKGDPHTKGLAVDAYIGGHPIGEVIPPDEWSKLGITSGAMPGFYKGKPDPEHLQLTGIPIKQGGR